MTRSLAPQTVTLLKPVPAMLAHDLGIAAGAAGDVLTLPYRDALALVATSVARWGSAALDTALAPTAFASLPTRAV